MAVSDDQISSDGRCLFRLHASVVILDSARRVLLVQEEKAASRGRWNLPGGHVDHGEDLIASAMREALEETHLVCQPKALVGIYTRRESVRIVVLCDNWAGQPAAGDQILAVRWFSLPDALALRSDQLVGNTAEVLCDVQAGRLHPVDVITPFATR